MCFGMLWGMTLRVERDVGSVMFVATSSEPAGSQHLNVRRWLY